MVVDDEILLGMELEYVLSEVGYRIVGPTTNIEQSLDLIATQQLDGAVLDLNLRGMQSGPIADRLSELDIPFLFLSGHTRDALPQVHRDRPLVTKPFMERRLLEALRALFD